MAAKPKPTKLPITIVRFEDAASWAAWLDQHHATSTDVWIRIAKKGTGIASVHYPEVLDVALCYGWIDAIRKPYDGETFLQRFTRRGARSIWSKINRDKALALIRTGAMKPAGLAEVERAKGDGRWQAAYDGQKTAKIPNDLATALAANPRAAGFFSTLDARNRYAILFRLHHAKEAKTRARRLATFVAMLNKHEKIHDTHVARRKRSTSSPRSGRK
ncbi:MAG: putative periplasmic rane protein [Myxococcales bacterium]|nr:putative periplasmic rane protein [Myxococcales bacterium]